MQVAIVTIDCSDPHALLGADKWIGEIHCSNIGMNIPIILVITKADRITNSLRSSSNRVISLEQVLQKAEQTPNIAFVCETSAKDNINVQALAYGLRLLLLQPQKMLPELLYFYSAARPGELQTVRRELVQSYPAGLTLDRWETRPV